MAETLRQIGETAKDNYKDHRRRAGSYYVSLFRATDKLAGDLDARRVNPRRSGELRRIADLFMTQSARYESTVRDLNTKLDESSEFARTHYQDNAAEYVELALIEARLDGVSIQTEKN